MNRRRFLGGIAALAAGCAACGRGGDGVLPASPTPVRPTARSNYLVIDESETIGLIFWEGLTYVSDVPERSQYIFDSMRVDLLNRSERYLGYMLDLMTTPNPFWGQAFQTMEEKFGPPGNEGPNSYWNLRGKRTPEDDTHAYLVFKKEFISRVQQDMGAFLDWNQPRTISAQEVIWGGVPVDGIPPLEHPGFVTAAEADSWAYPSDEVVAVEVSGEARVYPRRIIDWHEMVNDTIAGIPISLANCTLCGSAIVYDGRVAGSAFEFGTSGMLHRSNKLMYDRQTRSLWGQFIGEPVWGELVGKGIRLDSLPAVHTTYGEWMAAHPESLVLDINTGHIRDYNPGAAYADYFGTSALLFPVPDRSGAVEPKSVVLVVRVGDVVAAYPADALKQRKFIEDDPGGVPVLVLATASGNGGRAYQRLRDFASYEPATGVLVDGDGGRWTVTEQAIEGPGGQRGERLPGHNAFWFALANHAPNASLWTP